jgi:hypothetical protein
MKITYLFGAGASAEALPVVTEMPGRINSMLILLNDKKDILLDETPLLSRFEFTKVELYDLILKDLKWLLDQSFNHVSIDTYAKKLTIKTNMSNEIHRLKVILSVFFTLEQAKNKFDSRYDSFYASLLTDSLDTLPRNIRIINWNYDFQFEKAFSEYSDRKQISSNQDYLNVISKRNYKRISNDKFSIYKINGTTGFIDINKRSQYQFCDKMYDDLSSSTINSVLNSYALLMVSDANYQSSLSFAWEMFADDNEYLSKILDDTSDTSILVVIGYSFPFFNREIDRQIIKNMKSLTKVYFQSPQADILRDRFTAILPSFNKNQLIVYNDVGQFLLPDEL